MMTELRHCNIFDLLLWLLRRRHRFQVSGVSMLPLLSPGDEVLVNKYAYQRSLPQVNDIVVLESPQTPNFFLIKRVKCINAEGQCFLQGDNLDHSTDSRSFGWVAPHHLLGRVTSRFL